MKMKHPKITMIKDMLFHLKTMLIPVLRKLVKLTKALKLDRIIEKKALVGTMLMIMINMLQWRIEWTKE